MVVRCRRRAVTKFTRSTSRHDRQCHTRQSSSASRYAQPISLASTVRVRRESGATDRRRTLISASSRPPSKSDPSADGDVQAAHGPACGPRRSPGWGEDGAREYSWQRRAPAASGTVGRVVRAVRGRLADLRSGCCALSSSAAYRSLLAVSHPAVAGGLVGDCASIMSRPLLPIVTGRGSSRAPMNSPSRLFSTVAR